MIFDPPLQLGRLLNRYKRFLADIHTANGQPLTIHCPNTGSMKNCLLVDSPCWYWDSANPKRKLPHTLELVTTPTGHLACVNTARPNALVVEAIENGTVSELQDYQQLKTEVRYGHENSRIDILLSGGQQSIYVEVKNTTLLEEDGIGYFPDAVSARASKHLRELIAMVAAGQRGVIFFCVNHTGIERVRPADHIDPLYGKLLREAAAVGVELLAYRSEIKQTSIQLTQPLAVELPELAGESK
jgi:sugar fermentation stimulation protein A